MAKTVSLQADSHQVAVKIKGSRYFVEVDGAPGGEYKLSKTSYWTGINEDFPLYIDDKLYLLVLRGKKIRMAADGRYLDDGGDYTPAVPLPGWIWIFIILNLLIPIISLGGAMNVVLALLGILGCSAVARSAKTGNTAVKLILCIVITVVVWIVWFGLVGGVAALLA